MKTTLAERIRERMTELKVTSNAELARLVKLKPPSTLLWLNGTTKNLKGENLLRSAKLLGVTPEWLESGKTPKFPEDAAAIGVNEEAAYYHRDANIIEAVQLLEAMEPKARAEALSFLRIFAAKKGGTATKRPRVRVPAAAKAAA